MRQVPFLGVKETFNDHKARSPKQQTNKQATTKGPSQHRQCHKENEGLTKKKKENEANHCVCAQRNMGMCI